MSKQKTENVELLDFIEKFNMKHSNEPKKEREHKKSKKDNT